MCGLLGATCLARASVPSSCPGVDLTDLIGVLIASPDGRPLRRGLVLSASCPSTAGYAAFTGGALNPAFQLGLDLIQRAAANSA